MSPSVRVLRYIALLRLACLVLSVNIIYDEALWTKQDWKEYVIDFEPTADLNPSDEVILQKATRELIDQATYNSLDGTSPRRKITRPPTLWRQADTGAEAMDDPRSIDLAAEAVQCTVCTALVSTAWRAVVAAVHAHEPLNEPTVKDILDEAADTAVPDAVLPRFTIHRIGADAGPAEVTWFVVRERKRGATSTTIEAAAVAKACQLLLDAHRTTLAKAMLAQAKAYFEVMLAAQRKYTLKLAAIRRGVDEDDDYEDPGDEDEDEDEGQRDKRKALSLAPSSDSKRSGGSDAPTLCADLHFMCPAWAVLGECEANPKYMTGHALGVAHCRLSCGLCKPDSSWETVKGASEELTAAVAKGEQVLRSQGCSDTHVCLSSSSTTSGGSTALAVVDKALLPPGAALLDMPGFVLGKPFWGVPVIGKPHTDGKRAAKPGGTEPDHEGGDVEMLLHQHMGNRVLSIRGMDGFFQYELLYKQKVYQYHENLNGKISESWLLGMYDEAASHRLQTGSHKVLDPLDYLPTAVHGPGMMKKVWPYFGQVYNGGDVCSEAGVKKRQRSAELRFACSPDTVLHMLVREPQFCEYIIVIYTPSLCDLEDYKPVVMRSSSSSSKVALASADKDKTKAASGQAQKT